MATWIPVIRTSYDSWLGVMPDGKLGVGKEHEGRVSLDASGYVVAWPLLERDLSVCLDELLAAWSVLGGHDVSTAYELVERIARTAWLSGRRYWMELALTWLMLMVRMPQFAVSTIRELLETAAESDVISQELREQARATLRGLAE